MEKGRSEFTLLLGFERGCFQKIFCRWRSLEFYLRKSIRVSWERLAEFCQVGKCSLFSDLFHILESLSPSCLFPLGVHLIFASCFFPSACLLPISSWTPPHMQWMIIQFLCTKHFLCIVGIMKRPLSSRDLTSVLGRKMWHQSTGKKEHFQCRDTVRCFAGTVQKPLLSAKWLGKHPSSTDFQAVSWEQYTDWTNGQQSEVLDWEPRVGTRLAWMISSWAGGCGIQANVTHDDSRNLPTRPGVVIGSLLWTWRKQFDLSEYILAFPRASVCLSVLISLFFFQLWLWVSFSFSVSCVFCLLIYFPSIGPQWSTLHILAPGSV